MKRLLFSIALAVLTVSAHAQRALTDTGVQTVTGAKSFAQDKLCIDGGTSGKICFRTSAIAGTTPFDIGTGGAAVTAVDYGDSRNFSAADVTATRNNTAVATGTIDTLRPGSFNVLSGEWEWSPYSDCRPQIGPGEAVLLSLDEAPADGLTLRAILLLDVS